MKNNFNNTTNNNFFMYSVHHAPLIVDINTQRSYRKWGHVSWPEMSCQTIEISSEQQRLKTILGEGGHVSWPRE